MTLRIFFVASIIFLVGCQVMPVRYDQETQGEWNSKVLIKDKAKKKSFIVNVDFKAIKNERLRMDVTATLGTPVAALAMNGKNMEFALIREKKFYSGRAREGALKPILAIPLDPMMLHNLLFDLPMENKNWSCIRDDKGFLMECRDLRQKLKITWRERRGRKKQIFIDHNKASLQINIKSFQPKIDDGEEVFHIPSPKSFKKYKL